MIKDFFVRKLIERQLKNIPKEQQEKIIKMVTEHPELFEKIATEVKAKTDSGMEQQAAVMSVMKNYQDELQKLI